MTPPTAIHTTLQYLRLCQRAKAEGYPVAFTTDLRWMVNMAVNRRAGWPDDPSELRGSARPVNGRYPAKASGSRWNHLRLLARKINTRKPRLIVRPGELGEWRPLLLRRIPDRILMPDEE